MTHLERGNDTTEEEHTKEDNNHFHSENEDSLLNQENYDPSSETTEEEGGRNKKALGICKWYNSESRGFRKSAADYVGRGYFSVVKLLKDKNESEIKKILTFYMDSDKFDKHPMLTAALSADSLRIYYES